MSDRTYTAHDLTVGDTVRVDKLVSNWFRGDYLIGVVADISDGLVTLGGLVIDSRRCEFQILRFANGLPNTPAIAWVDTEHREHVALRNGHALNHSWRYNGRAVSADTILELADGARIAGLDWVDVP